MSIVLIIILCPIYTGFMESISTYKALADLRSNIRPFVLSRATFPGAGSYAAHWNGREIINAKRHHNNVITYTCMSYLLQVTTQPMTLTCTTVYP